MGRAALIAVLVLIASISLGQAIEGTFGTAVQVSANTATEIRFLLGVGPTLTITADSACSVIVNQKTTFTALPDSNFRTINLATEVGYEIKRSSGTCNIVSGTLKTGAVSASAIAQVTAAIAAGGNVGCLTYDASANAYSHVAVQTVSSGISQSYQVAVPRFAQYIFVSYANNIPLPSAYADVQIVGK